MKNRIDILSLQREINNYEIEPLSAVIPSVVINDIWHMLSYVENALRILGFCILLVSLISMVSILMATLNERRREMSILRALGASPKQLAGLLVVEATIISFAALLLGVLLDLSLIFFLKDWLKENYGLFLESGILSWAEVYYLIGIVILGSFVGLIPALRVYKTSLKDGLIIK